MMSLMELTPQARQYLKNKGISLLDQKIFRIFTDEKISLGTFEGSKAIEKSQIVSWDTPTTRIIGASLTISAQPVDPWATLTLRMNDETIDRKEWGYTDTSAYTKTIDVADRLINGLNIFKITWEKIGFRIIPVTVQGVSLNLLLTYEGVGGQLPTPPSILPIPTLPVWAWYGIGGIIGVGVLIGIAKVATRR